MDFWAFGRLVGFLKVLRWKVDRRWGAESGRDDRIGKRSEQGLDGRGALI